MLCQVRRDLVDDGLGECEGAARRCGLCGTDGELAADFGEGLLDENGAAEHVEVPGLECCQLSEAEAAVGGGEEESAVIGMDRSGEGVDLVSAEEAHLVVVKLGKFRVCRRGAGNQPLSPASNWEAAFRIVVGA